LTSLQNLHSFPTRRSSDLQQRKADQLKQSNNKAQTDLKDTQEQSKKAVDALNAQRDTWNANEKVLAKQRQELADAEKVKKAQKEDRKSTRLNSSHVSISYA